MTATDTTAPVGRTEADTWAAGWAMLLGDAFAAADRAGRVEWREGGGGPLHVSSGDTRLTVAVAPGSYQTSPDGRDWADGGTAPDGGYGPRVAFDSEADGVAPFLPPAGRADRGLVRALLAALGALDALPSGMGWRHGELVATLRHTPHRRGTSRRSVVSHVLARVDSDGLSLCDVPA